MGGHRPSISLCLSILVAVWTTTTIDSGGKARSRTGADASATNELMWLESLEMMRTFCCVLQNDRVSSGRDTSIHVDIRLFTQPGPDVGGRADGPVEPMHRDC